MKTWKWQQQVVSEKCSNFSWAHIDAPEQIHADEPHRHDFYQIILLEQGEAWHVVDLETYHMKAPAVSVVFPQQIHLLRFSPGVKARKVCFDETIFCSEILANELKEYNIDLQKRINFLDFSTDPEQFQRLLHLQDEMEDLYREMSMIRKMQIKFLVKILLLKLIDFAPKQVMPVSSDRDVQFYIRFRAAVDQSFARERKLSYYAVALGISVKKLTQICQKYGGLSPLEMIHEKLSLEIKKRLIQEDVSLKELAFDLGFSSQSALNKYIVREFQMTPSALKTYVSRKAHGK